MKPSIKTFFERHEFLIPLGLFAIFLALTLPGISWGAPGGWHPDEIVYIAIRTLQNSDFDFDASNFNHPHLPIYAMLWLGRILAIGPQNWDVLVAARVLSAILIGLTIILAYKIPRQMGYSIWISGLGGLILLSVSEMTHNAHFAHNDTFVTFFSTLTIFMLVIYKTTGRRGWLYASFFSSGLSVSSKYSAVTLAVVPFIYHIWTRRSILLKRPLRAFETLFIGLALVFLGYATGTPKALTWMAYYIKRVVPALKYNATYWVLPDSVRGVIGQYEVLMRGVGLPLFLLFGFAFLWGIYKVLMFWMGNLSHMESNRFLLLLTIFVIDAPIMVSYNYPIRFFLPLMPFLAILGAMFIRDMYELAEASGATINLKLINICLILVLMLSLGRVVSVMLLFKHDARLPASEFLALLPLGTSLEHTFYPPNFPSERFEREHNYPLFFPKRPDDTPPVDKQLPYNQAEAGLNGRLTEYFVVDSFTSDKFNNRYICASVKLECDFFKQLATGRSQHYALLVEFSYTLPRWLPQITVDFVNPTIRVYERIP